LVPLRIKSCGGGSEMRTLSAVAAMLMLGAGTPGTVAAADPPSAREFYVQAVAAMSDLSQPPYVTYRMEGSAEGLQVGLTTISGQVWLNIGAGSTSDRWTLRHRTYDYQSEIVSRSDGRRYVSQRSFFDPTWYGAYRALRLGMLYSQDPAEPRPSPGVATPTPDPTLKTIGAIKVMGPAIYDVEDRGTAVCPSGAPGRALHLTSRTRDAQHQLSDVLVDLRSMRFCMMRFGTAAALGFHGIVEQHYGDVGGYWMQIDGFLDGTLRVFGVSTHHGVWRDRLLDMQFPSSLPPDTFAANTPAGT
jgi:hypothetical protein